MSKQKQIEYDEHIIDQALDEIMHTSYMSYAEYVTMERALPRVEDGLKPVQRRILYTLHELGIVPDKPYKKSARIVGDCLGKYHPHGDSSVYEAMVRMSQDFAMRMPLVDGHGNFGSIDGDSAAAMRYTEARMSPLALEMLRDMDKDTVPFRPNFDDTEREPDMLPARYPNLLVNGSSGIAVGLATNIPPHNLGEVIDGVIKRMKKPNCSLDEMMKHIKGPDFPTGGYLIESDALKQAYETGRGRVQMRAKAHFEKGINGRTKIVVTEMPYDVRKSNVLERILATSESRKEIFGAIDDIRDESDREGMRAVIEIKRGHDAEAILDLLYKYSDLQSTFGINMMVIAEGTPQQLGLLEILDYYIAHQKNVVTRRTQYDLEKAEKREHILQGLMIAVRNIDEVIKIIRAAKNTAEAKRNLMKRFDITGVQAQAILDMRLARLTNLEVERLEEEYAEVVEFIGKLRAILDSDDQLQEVIRKELLDVKKKYADKRRTILIDEKSARIEVDESDFIESEDCVVVLLRSGSVKRMTQRALQMGVEAGNIVERHRPTLLVSTNTAERIYMFTNKGNMYMMPVEDLPEGRIRDAGRSLNALLTGVDSGEKILNILSKEDFKKSKYIYFASKHGQAKATLPEEFDVQRTKIVACGLRKGDELIYVQPDHKEADNMFFATSDGYSINIKKDTISDMGRPALGVGAIRLEKGAEVILVEQIDSAQETANVMFITEKGFAKQTPLIEFTEQGRNGKGLKTFDLTKKTGDRIAGALLLPEISTVTTVQKSGDIEKITTDTVPVDERNTKGEQVVLAMMGNDVEQLYQNIFD